MSCGVRGAGAARRARGGEAWVSSVDALSIVDYLYLGQIPPLLFATDVWQEVRHRLQDSPDLKQRLQTAIGQIASVRNEIAHVREVETNRLLSDS